MQKTRQRRRLLTGTGLYMGLVFAAVSIASAESVQAADPGTNISSHGSRPKFDGANTALRRATSTDEMFAWMPDAERPVEHYRFRYQTRLAEAADLDG